MATKTNVKGSSVKKEKKSTKKETYSYKGWLNSDSFLKRAFAVLGYQSVGVLVIYGVFLVIAIILGIIFGVLSLVFGGIASLF